MSVLKRVFISGTVYDLKKERAFFKSLLESYGGGVHFKCLLSEAANFPSPPSTLTDMHSYDICISNIASSDYVVLLIKQRYNAPIIQDEGSLISITHREYRESFRRRLPLFIFVDERTWDARILFKRGAKQDFVSEKHIGLFNMIEEIVHQPRNNWIHIYKNLDDIKTVIETSLFNFDDSTFVRDITIPDGTIIQCNSEFEKIWEIKNNGCIIWEGRFLQEENAGASFLIPNHQKVPIPRTLPSETVQIAVRFKAPKYPGTCESYWKIVDLSGRHCFPTKKGLLCRVKVVY